MTHNTRSSFVSASTGAAVAGAILSASIISGAPAVAAEAQEGAPSKMPPLIYSPSAEFCAKGSAPGAKEVCITGNIRLPNNQEANEGPPTDPKVFEEQQEKLREDLQKRADELRKRLESQDGNRPSAP